MAECHFHSSLTPSGILLQAASSQPLSWPVGVRSSLLTAAQHSGMTSLLATKKMPGGQLLLAGDSPPNLLLHKAGRYQGGVLQLPWRLWKASGQSDNITLATFKWKWTKKL